MNYQIVVMTMSLVLLLASASDAQTSVFRVSIDSGTLVRVTPKVGSPVVGRLFQVANPSSRAFALCRYPGPPCRDEEDSQALRSILTASVAKLEVQRGNHLAMGLVLGGAIGPVVGVALTQSKKYMLAGAVTGAALGALFGSSSPLWRAAR